MKPCVACKNALASANELNSIIPRYDGAYLADALKLLENIPPDISVGTLAAHIREELDDPPLIRKGEEFHDSTYGGSESPVSTAVDRDAQILANVKIENGLDGFIKSIEDINKRAYVWEQGDLIAALINKYPTFALELDFIEDELDEELVVKTQDGRVLISVQGAEDIQGVQSALNSIDKNLDIINHEAWADPPTLYTEGDFNPRGHETVKSLVYLHDRSIVKKMLKDPIHLRIRKLEEVSNKAHWERGPFSLSEHGKYTFLLYKRVEIVFIATKDIGVPNKKRKKPRPKHKDRDREWFKLHLTICSDGCRHCHRGEFAHPS